MHKLIGQKAVVTIKNRSAALTGPMYTQPTFDLEGVIMASPKWEKGADLFAMYIASSDVPLRVIHLHNVVAVNGHPMTQVKPRRADDTFYVASTHGPANYTVIRAGDHWSCDCQGFRFRKTCRHIGIAQTQSKVFGS